MILRMALVGAATLALAAMTACGDGGSDRHLTESVAAGLVRGELGLANRSQTIHCEVLEFPDEDDVWSVRCSMTDALGKKWSDWSVDDRSSEVTALPAGDPGFPTNTPN
jgi:hypothetical protein